MQTHRKNVILKLNIKMPAIKAMLNENLAVGGFKVHEYAGKDYRKYCPPQDNYFFKYFPGIHLLPRSACASVLYCMVVQVSADLCGFKTSCKLTQTCLISFSIGWNYRSM